MKKQLIFNKTLAKMLIRSGFKMTNISINRNDTENSMYWFEDKEGLTEVIEHYVSAKILEKQEQELKAI